METAAISGNRCCAHCGLPVPAAASRASGEVFCCQACRLVALIIGKQEESDHAWTLLRLGLGALLAMNIMMISLLLYTGSIETAAVPVFRRVLMVMAVPALTVLIPPFLAGAAREFHSRRLSLDTLIAGGSLSAFAISAWNVVTGTGEIYFDTATMLPVLVTIGKIVEASAKSKAADLLKSLESLLPATALRMGAGEADEVAIELLRPGDQVRVRPGERVPVDGRVLEGSSCIMEAAFSGEFLPRLCHPGDSVVAGTVNGSGSLVVQAERTGRDLLLHGIIEMIHNAWRNSSRSERIAERAAACFIPVVLAIAAASFAGWGICGNLSRALLSALSVLVVACPCTMGIATPLATSLAVARAAKEGVIVRGGKVIEELAGTEMIFFDKTGTLTVGKPILRQVIPLDPNVEQDELLGRTAALESASEHPLGEAIVAAATKSRIERGSCRDVRVYPGTGMAGEVCWRDATTEVRAGAPDFVTPGTATASIEGNGTVVDVAWGGKARGRFILSDTIRDDARACMNRLGRDGIACILLSGDRLAAAVDIAGQAGIAEVYASRTPEQKLEAIDTAVAAGRTVVMVGDGVNDAPALAAAHAGIAFGGALDLARHAGNAVILSGRLTQIPWLIDLSKLTLRVIRGNFAWSFLYNGIALAAAAAGLLHPLLAALLMVISSLTVIGNSMRVMSFSE